MGRSCTSRPRRRRAAARQQNSSYFEAYVPGPVFSSPNPEPPATHRFVTPGVLSPPQSVAEAPLAGSERYQGARLDFDSVYAEHAGFVWRALSRLGVPPEHLADATQDVFVVVLRR